MLAVAEYCISVACDAACPGYALSPLQIPVSDLRMLRLLFQVLQARVPLPSQLQFPLPKVGATVVFESDSRSMKAVVAPLVEAVAPAAVTPWLSAARAASLS